MIKIIYEDDRLVACIKPIGVPSQTDTGNDLVAMLSEQTGGRVYAVHRLDTAVGGVMVYAKSSRTAAELSALIQKGEFSKEYFAAVHSAPSAESGVYEDLLFKDSRKNKSFVVKRERKGVKKASLEYETLSEADGKSLVRIRLHTGRTHQIRVQFSSRKMPLIGDGKYGSKDNGCTVALWSYRLKFKLGEKDFCFEAEPDFTKYPWNVFDASWR